MGSYISAAQCREGSGLLPLRQMLRSKAIFWTLVAWVRAHAWRGLSTAMLPVLLSTFAASGLSFAWCESMQQVSCCCCDGEPTLDQVLAELSNDREASKLEAAPCCESREMPSVPVADTAVPQDETPVLMALAVLPVAAAEPASRFSAHSLPPPSARRPSDPARAGPTSASERHATLQRYHC